MSQHFDLIWIGTGQATLTVVPRLAAAGKRVAVIEGGEFGGTCVNRGCTPTKTLVASAYAVHMAHRGDEFGFSVKDVAVDFAKVMGFQQANRARATAGIREALEGTSTVFPGYAEFIDDKTLSVNGNTLTADTIVIHTGTRPADPDVPGADSVSWLNNESLLDLTEAPAHLAVVGGSYIALEFAQIFRRLGSEVTVFQRSARLVSKEDADISAAVAQVMRDDGINVICNSSLKQLGPAGGVTVDYLADGQPARLQASHILFAAGRVANSESLQPAAAGLDLGPKGFINVNQVMQTNVPHIFAVGDINGQGAFTHTSVNDGEIFFDHYARAHGLSDDLPEYDRSLGLRTLVYSMFIDPPLARVGMNETEARASGRKVLMATAPMSSIARAREKRETKGLVKILVDADSEQVLGATVFGSSGDEVIAAFAVFIQTGLSWKHFRRVVLPHPTIAELMPWIMDGLEPLD